MKITEKKSEKRIKGGKRKKAFLFTMDAFLASLLLVGALIMLSQVHVQKSSTENMEFLSQDILETLSTVKIYEIRDSNDFVKKELEAGNISNINNSILVQIGEYWAINKPGKARELARSVIDELIPDSYGFNLSIGGDIIYNKSNKNLSNAISTSRMISGIEKGKPIKGSTSDAFLKSIRNKPSSVYLYFGGFVGQGNITGQLYVPPVDNVTQIVMELQAGTLVRLYMNGEQCNESGSDEVFNPSPPTPKNMTADIWDITHCNKSIYKTGGLNNFTFIFSSINGAYIGGGYIRVSYRTDEFQEIDYGVNVTRFYMPGIEGIVNLFDSFYVPGELKNLSMRLHYIANHTYSNYTFYVTIGNKTVYWDNDSVDEIDINLSDANFTMLNYSAFNSSTIPIRIGFENVSFQQVVTGGEGFGDIVLITDTSGSMNWTFTSSSAGVERFCNDSQLYNSNTKRLSVAKCVEKIFIDDVFKNTTLNRVGLSEYNSGSISTYPLTNSKDELNAQISLYTAGGSTCTGCGLYDAIQLLIDPPPAQLHNDEWKFSLEYQFIDPPSGWISLSFDDSNWSTGKVPFGFDAGVNTIIGNYDTFADLWQHYSDDSGLIVDFNSGILNTTGNTFGWSGANDGWDSTAGSIYSGDNTNVNIYNLEISDGGDYELRMGIGQSTTGTSNYQTSAGAYGIKFNITQEMIDVLNNGGYALLSFDWQWKDGRVWNDFELNDQVWIKARITDTSGISTYLGTNEDGSHQNGDGALDVFAQDDPDGDAQDMFTEDISSLITNAGMYYLDFGGKLYRNYLIEYGNFYFDNVQLVFVNLTGNITYRTEFTLNGLSRFSDAKLYVASDDGAEVYLNGNLISSDPGPHSDFEWNVDAVQVSMSDFVEGKNILAVRHFNNDLISYFDLELRANMTNRQKALVLMTDGEGNYCHTNDGVIDLYYQGWDCGTSNSDTRMARSRNETIEMAKYAYENHNISIYTVAFSNLTGATGLYAIQTLNLTACIDNCSHFYKFNNVSGISQIYQDIADSILTGFSSRQSQVIVVAAGGDYEESTLFPDSFIEINYSPIIEKPATNEISLSFESPKFENCTPQVDIPTGIRVIDSKIISYSGHHWTDFVGVNGIEVFNLSHYNNITYIALGDPFVINIPPSLLVPGTINNIKLKTGDEPVLNTNCSGNNSLQYVGMINASTGRTLVLPGTEGCNWTVESEDLLNVTMKIPNYYNGSKNCNYTNASIFYDSNSTYDAAVYLLLRGLDFDRDGRTIINLEEENLEIKVILVTGLPFQWGPSVVEAHVWQ